jgi:hypothetical protein
LLALVSSRGSPMEIKVLNKHWSTRGKPRMLMIPITSLTSSMREMQALIKIGNMHQDLLKTILQPQFIKSETSNWEESWESEFQKRVTELNIGTGFVRHLETFNQSQQRAILTASRTTTLPSSFIRQSNETSITLVKGPPGTGVMISQQLTHTITCFINLSHLHSHLSHVRKDNDTERHAQSHACSRI